MFVLQFHAWQKMGQIHRYSAPQFVDKDRRTVRVRYSELLDRANSFVIMVSHKWLDELEAHEVKGWQKGEAVAHPDLVKQGHPKFTLIVKAVRALQKGPLKDKSVFLWIDYCCVPTRQEASHSSYVERCDALLTPLVEAPDAKIDWWANSDPGDNFFFDHAEYLSPAWRAYSEDAWCRLDFFLAAYAPFHADCINFFKLIDASSRRRPERVHLVYGDREVVQQEQQRQQQQQGACADAPSIPILISPIPLPEMANSFLSELHPLLGNFQNEQDRGKVQLLVTVMIKYRAEIARRARWLKMKSIGGKGMAMATAMGGLGQNITQHQYVVERKEGSKTNDQLRRLLEKRVQRESRGWGRDHGLSSLERRFLGVQAHKDVSDVLDGHPLASPVLTPVLTPRSAIRAGAEEFSSAMGKLGRKL
jgi:hypothetical protein